MITWYGKTRQEFQKRIPFSFWGLFFSNVNVLALDPSLTLPIQQVVLVSASLAPSVDTILASVARHV